MALRATYLPVMPEPSVLSAGGGGEAITGVPVPFIIIIIIIIIINITANELSLSGSSPYTGTDKKNMNKYT